MRMHARGQGPHAKKKSGQEAAHSCPDHSDEATWRLRPVALPATPRLDPDRWAGDLSPMA
jgi:hypothetical protein